MPSSSIRCAVISNFTAQPLTDALAVLADEPRIDATILDGPVESALIRLASGQIAAGSETALVWTQPESVLPSVASRLALDPAALSTVRDDVARYAQLLVSAAERFSYVFVPTWTNTQTRPGLALLSMSVDEGWTRALLQANAWLAEAVASTPAIQLLDATQWQLPDQNSATADRLWLRARIPYPLDVFGRAASSLAQVIRALYVSPRKLIIVDLDDTLWGGILGELGQGGIRLGGHDPVGEAYREFQFALKAVSRTGVLLAIVSKNDETEALRAIGTHPEMVLRRDDFVAWRINRQDKAANIVELAEQLGLGLDSVVFIDDHPAERHRVTTVLPEVLVPEWPLDPTSFRSALFALSCFDRPHVTAEDRNRANTYSAGRVRDSVKRSANSPDAWLASLETVVSCELLDETNVIRAAQLLNKTNQMNLTTRRMTEHQLLDWSRKGSTAILSFRVKDKLADYGLTGLVGLEVVESVLNLTDFVVSCRVFGRGVEEAMLGRAIEWGRLEGGVKEFAATYKPTARNAPTLEFLRSRSGLRQIDERRFEWIVSNPYVMPSFIACSWAPVRQA